jgi:hypothetical protein
MNSTELNVLRDMIREEVLRATAAVTPQLVPTVTEPKPSQYELVRKAAKLLTEAGLGGFILACSGSDKQFQRGRFFYSDGDVSACVGLADLSRIRLLHHVFKGEAWESGTITRVDFDDSEDVDDYD